MRQRKEKSYNKKIHAEGEGIKRNSIALSLRSLENRAKAVAKGEERYRGPIFSYVIWLAYTTDKERRPEKHFATISRVNRGVA